MKYRDYEGNFISDEEWFILNKDITSMRLKQEWLRGYMISTVWVGLSYAYETMVFTRNGDAVDNFTLRYQSKKEAIEGHTKTLQLIKDYTELLDV